MQQEHVQNTIFIWVSSWFVAVSLKYFVFPPIFYHHFILADQKPELFSYPNKSILKKYSLRDDLSLCTNSELSDTETSSVMKEDLQEMTIYCNRHGCWNPLTLSGFQCRLLLFLSSNYLKSIKVIRFSLIYSQNTHKVNQWEKKRERKFILRHFSCIASLLLQHQLMSTHWVWKQANSYWKKKRKYMYFVCKNSQLITNYIKLFLVSNKSFKANISLKVFSYGSRECWGWRLWSGCGMLQWGDLLLPVLQVVDAPLVAGMCITRMDVASSSNKRDALTAEECIIEFVRRTDECSHLHGRQVGALANTRLLNLNSVPLNST